jgi:glycosyltransferase involved in cell wall biosynthesis
MPEVGGDAACLVNPYEIDEIRQGIMRIINDLEYRETLIDRGFQNINRFKPDLIAHEYLKLYRKLDEQN